MATKRFYAYYIRGNQLAIIEYDSIAGDGQTLDQPGLNDIGPGGGLQWKSPTVAVTDGIEIEYAYSPRYTMPGLESTIFGSFRNHFYVNGWINVDGYLTLVSSSLQWESMTKVVVGNYIAIRGSSRWNGIHKVKAIQNASVADATHGGVQTHTKVFEETKVNSGTAVTWNEISETITGFNFLSMDHFDEDSDPYIWVSGSEEPLNNGFFSGWTDSGVSPTVVVDFSGATRYKYSDSLTEETLSAAAFTGDTEAGYIYKAYHEPSMYAIAGVDVLDDELDTIDLPPYLANALVYYVKAKYDEDIGKIDSKDYNLKEFRRMLEKYENAKIWGARMIGPGPSAIR